MINQMNKNLLAIVPHKKEFILNKMYTDLCNIKDIEVCCVKGMLFISASTIDGRDETLKYLNDNNHLFDYAR